jgi:hypothetical protein
MTAQEFSKALGMTESRGDPNVEPGDGGCAMGRFQAHPDWLDTWKPHYGIRARLNETWDSMVERVIEAFFADHSRYLTPLLIAMYYHKGHQVIPDDPDWDKTYAARFEHYANAGEVEAAA